MLVATARLAGLSWEELGFRNLRRGLKWSGVIIGAAAVVLAAGAALPLTREAFRDDRYRLAWAARC